MPQKSNFSIFNLIKPSFNLCGIAVFSFIWIMKKPLDFIIKIFPHEKMNDEERTYPI